MLPNKGLQPQTGYRPLSSAEKKQIFNLDSDSDSESDSEPEEKPQQLPLNSFNDPLTAFPINGQKRSTNPFDLENGFRPHNQNAHSTQPLQYLQVFNKNELRNLQNHYSKSSHELDDIVKNHQWIYRGLQVDYWFSLATVTPSLLFQILASRDGIQSAAILMSKNIAIPSTTALVFSTPLALMDLAYNWNRISPRKKALQATLAYAEDKIQERTYRKQVENFLTTANDQPGLAFGIAVQCVFNKSVLYTHNFIRATTGILAFYEPLSFTLPVIGPVTLSAGMPTLPRSTQLGIAAVFFYGGNRFYSLSSNRNYYHHFDQFWMQGIRDLWNNDSNSGPWLIRALSHGNLATPLQIIMQGLIGATLIQTYPCFYYLAQRSFHAIGGLDLVTATHLAIITALLSTWHTLCTHYPDTYHWYLDDQIKIEAFLRKTFQASATQQINNLIENTVDSLELVMSIPEVNRRKENLKKQFLHNLVMTSKKLLQNQIIEGEKDYFPLRKDPSLALQLPLQTLAGGYFGYSIITPLLCNYIIDEPLSMTIVGIYLGTGLFAGVFYQANKNRITDQLLWQQIKTQDIQKVENQINRTSKYVADCMTIGRNVSHAFSTLGYMQRIAGPAHSATMPTLAVFTFTNMLHTILLSIEKVRTHVSNWSCFTRKNNQQPSYLSRGWAALFNRKSVYHAVPVEEKQTTSNTLGPRAKLNNKKG